MKSRLVVWALVAVLSLVLVLHLTASPIRFTPALGNHTVLLFDPALGAHGSDIISTVYGAPLAWTSSTWWRPGNWSVPSLIPALGNLNLATAPALNGLPPGGVPPDVLGAIPEPSITSLMLGAALFGALAWRRRGSRRRT